MTAKILQDALRRVGDWPEAAQFELAQIALEIEAGFGAGAYHATPKELEGIDQGVTAAREGRFATDDQVKQVFKNNRPT
jgi:predicted transcriptional regulator